MLSSIVAGANVPPHAPEMYGHVLQGDLTARTVQRPDPHDTIHL